MTDHELERRLRAWYGEQIEAAEPTSPGLRATILDIPLSDRGYLGLPRLVMGGRSIRWSILVAALLLVILAFGAVVATLIRPTPPPGPGFISFSRQATDGRWETYVLNPDGSDPVVVTHAQVLGRLAWSPDGTQFAFCSDLGLHVANADGSGMQLIRASPSGCDSPAWSPDGDRIAVGVSASVETGFDIWIMNVDGTQPDQLTAEAGQDLAPTWSPAGSEIAFVRETEIAGGFRDEIVVARVDGSSTRIVAMEGVIYGSPAWSPDGRLIAFSRRLFPAEGLPSSYDPPWDIWVMNADGSTPHQVTFQAGSEVGPAWSPDGLQMVFGTDIGIGTIWVMNADGSNGHAISTLDALPFPAWSAGTRPQL